MTSTHSNLYHLWTRGSLDDNAIAGLRTLVDRLLPTLVAADAPNWEDPAIPLAVELLYDVNLVDLDGTPRPLAAHVPDGRQRLTLAGLRLDLEAAFARLVLRELPPPQIAGPIHRADALRFIEGNANSAYWSWFAEHARMRDARGLLREWEATLVDVALMRSLLLSRAPRSGAIGTREGPAAENGPGDGTNRTNPARPSASKLRHLLARLDPEPRRPERFDSGLNVQTRYFSALLLTAARLGYLEGAGALLCLEHGIAQQRGRILEGLRRLGLNEHDLALLDMRPGSDTGRDEHWWGNAIAPHLAGREESAAVLRGVALGIGAHNAFVQGLAIDGTAPATVAGIELRLEPKVA